MPTITRYATNDRQVSAGDLAWSNPALAREADEPDQTSYAEARATALEPTSEQRAWRNFPVLVENGGAIPAGATITRVLVQWHAQVALSTGALHDVTGAVRGRAYQDGVQRGAEVGLNNTTVRTTTNWTTVNLDFPGTPEAPQTTWTRDDFTYGAGGDTFEAAAYVVEFAGGGSIGELFGRLAWVRVVVEYTDPPDTVPPGVPTGLSGRRGSTRAWLDWDARLEPDLAGYRLRRGGTVVYDGPATTFEDTDLTNETEYSYTVSAYDESDNESAQSAAVLVTPTTMLLPDTDLYPRATLFPGPVTSTADQVAANIVSASSLGAVLRARSLLDSDTSGAATFTATPQVRQHLQASALGGAATLAASLRVRIFFVSNPSAAGVLSAPLAARTRLAADLAALGSLEAVPAALVRLGPAPIGGSAQFVAEALRARSPLAADFAAAAALAAAIHTQGSFEVNIAATTALAAVMRSRSRVVPAFVVVSDFSAGEPRVYGRLAANLGGFSDFASDLDQAIPYVHFKPPLDGEIVSILASGAVVVKLANGSVVVISAAGEILDTPAAGAPVIQVAGGTVVAPLGNGTVHERRNDGTLA